MMNMITLDIDASGNKVAKSASASGQGDLLDQALTE